jgi:hypothetical protein
MALACDLSNSLLKLHSFPIYGILCDGQSFDFFSFDGSTKPPTISHGVFQRNGGTFPSLPVGNPRLRGAIDFILGLRPICEAIFYCLLMGYRSGIKAYLQRSVHNGKGLKETWEKSLQQADEAIDLALKATSRAAIDPVSSNTLAEDALRKLTERLVSTSLRLY